MESVLDEKFFDLAVRVVNYAVEFRNTAGYVPIRLVDILKGLLELAPYMEGISRKAFYAETLERIEGRDILSSGEERAEFIDELFDLFIDEWRRTPT